MKTLAEWREARRQKKEEQSRPKWIIYEANGKCMISNDAAPGITLVVDQGHLQAYIEQVFNGDVQAVSRSLYRTLCALHRVFKGVYVTVGHPRIDRGNTILWKMQVAGYDLYVRGDEKFNLIADATQNGQKYVIKSPFGWGKFVSAIASGDLKALGKRFFG